MYALAEVNGAYIAGIPDSAPEALRHRILGAATGTAGTGGEALPAGVEIGSGRRQPKAIRLVSAAGTWFSEVMLIGELWKGYCGRLGPGWSSIRPSSTRNDCASGCR